MFDLVINSIVYDPGEIFSGQLGSPSSDFRAVILDNKPNWASAIAKKKDSLIEKMNKRTVRTNFSRLTSTLRCAIIKQKRRAGK